MPESPLHSTVADSFAKQLDLHEAMEVHLQSIADHLVPSRDDRLSVVEMFGLILSRLDAIEARLREDRPRG